MSQLSSHNTRTEIPITTTQRLILMGQLLQAKEPLYNMVMVYNLESAIDKDCFAQAFDTLVKNCDTMRLVFDDLNTQAKQYLLEEIDYSLPFIDLSTEEDPSKALEEWQNERKVLCFDLSKCLFDAALIKLSDASYVWYINQHHLATDAWSTQVIFNYVNEAYGLALKGELDQALPLPRFAEHALSQETHRTSKAFARASKYWQKKLDNPVPSSRFYRPVPSNRSSRTIRHRLVLSDEQSFKLIQMSEDKTFAAFSSDMGLMQLHATLLFSYLYRVSGQENLSLGTPSHSRTTASLKQTVGMLINIFPLQIKIDEQDSFVDVYQKVAQANQDLLINAVPGTQSSHSHSFDVVLNYLTANFDSFAGNDVSADWLHPDSGDRNHLMRLQVQHFDKNGPITLFFDLHEDVFKGQEIQWVLSHFSILLEAFLRNPSQLVTAVPLVEDLHEQDKVVNAHLVDTVTKEPLWAKSEFKVDGNTHIVKLLSDNLTQCAHKQGSLPSVIEGETQLDLTALHRRSDALASYLQGAYSQAKGSENNPPIAVYMPRSIDAVVAILAILKAKRSFLPLDIKHPASRRDFILGDANVGLVLTSSAHLNDIDANAYQVIAIDDKQVQQTLENTNIQALPEPDLEDIAYVIYTSGSTGQAKGVEVTHAGLANYLSWAKDFYLQGKSFNFPLFSPLSFDLTITSLFLPLISGGNLVIYPDDDASPITILNVIEDNRVDIIKLTPAHLVLIQQMDFSNSTIKKLIVGGDDFKTELAQVFDKYFAGNIEIYNEYGPTEATVACSVHQYSPLLDRGASVPIGKPIKNAAIYILDQHLQAVPQGVSGEIYIAGAGLAKAYLNQPELTNKRFIFHPARQSMRLYKTGDLGAYNSQGVLEYLGRNDNQIKVRGVRIETAEIEAGLLSFPNIKDSIVDLASNLGFDNDEDSQELAVEHCVKCGLAANHPSAQLDLDKVCRICRIYEKQQDLAQAYYQDLPTLQAWIDKIKARSTGKQDSIMLLSGGKDSSYTLCKLVDMGLTPLVFTLDNGYISEGAKANIKRLVDRLGLELIVGETEAMDDIFVDSLKRFSNVCNGCFKTIYTMSMKIAKERGISVICTGLSRGQIFETRVAHLFQQGCFSPDEIDKRIIDARKAYHRTDDIISRRLDVKVFQDDDVFEQIQYLDYFRYTDVTLDEMYDYLHNIAPWIRPSDTGRSTNCLINDAGIYVHKKERGYHNYALPYSWDVRLGHKERDAALDELDDEIDQQKVDDILKRVGYQYQKPKLQREDTLVAYYSGPAQIQKNTLQSHLAKTLPKEYIPTQFIWLEELPLTANGKVDRKALPRPQQSTRELSIDYIAPSTEVETTLAALWSQLLGVREVGIADNFFDLGGDSIVNIQIVSGAREAGIDISPQQVFDFPTIQELAKVAGKLNVFSAEQGQVTGEAQLLPIQLAFFDTLQSDALVHLAADDPSAVNAEINQCAVLHQRTNHFVQSVTLKVEKAFSLDIFQLAFYELSKQHDGLRSRFFQQNDMWLQEIMPTSQVSLEDACINDGQDLTHVLNETRRNLQQSLDIESGELLAASYIKDLKNDQYYLVIVVHHLVVDGVSWWVLLNDLAKLCEQISAQQIPALGAKTASVIQWREALDRYLLSRDIDAAAAYWQAFAKQHAKGAEAAIYENTSSFSHTAQTSVSLSEKDTAQLTIDVPAHYSVQTPELLLAALINSASTCEALPFDKHSQSLLVDIEGHGREDIIKDLSLSRTVAWFTSIFPVCLNAELGGLGKTLLNTKDMMRSIPNKGIDFGILKYLAPATVTAKILRKCRQPKVLFNYMGQWDRTLDKGSPFSFMQAISAHKSQYSPSEYAVEINCIIFEDQLRLDISYDKSTFDDTDMQSFAKLYKQEIKSAIDYCLSQTEKGFTPSDFPSANIAQDDLEDLFAEFGEDE